MSFKFSVTITTGDDGEVCYRADTNRSPTEVAYDPEDPIVDSDGDSDVTIPPPPIIRRSRQNRVPAGPSQAGPNSPTPTANSLVGHILSKDWFNTGYSWDIPNMSTSARFVTYLPNDFNLLDSRARREAHDKTKEELREQAIAMAKDLIKFAHADHPLRFQK